MIHVVVVYFLEISIAQPLQELAEENDQVEHEEDGSSAAEAGEDGETETALDDVPEEQVKIDKEEIYRSALPA